MPFTVRDLIDEQRKLITAHPEDTLQVALTRMTEHDLSQLPVVDDVNRGHEMVTSDSILRALKAFGVSPDKLLVRDASMKASVFRKDDDLFDLLDDLRDSYAVLIVDDEKHVVGIVTGYDATEYFRRRTEDMMFVEDIELMLRDHIQAAHMDSAGAVNEAALRAAIQRCASSQRKPFLVALQRYLDRTQSAPSIQRMNLNAKIADEVFGQAFEKGPPKSIGDLTFADYEEMILSKDQWSLYAKAFDPLPPPALRYMLDGVRETRNVLAHFRADVTPEQHDHLKFCVDWLTAHRATGLRANAGESGGDDADSPLRPGAHAESTNQLGVANEQVPLDDDLDDDDSRYAPLARYLVRQPFESDRVQLSFHDVEEILKGPLPPSARQHRAFWANDSVGHKQSRQWLGVDWRVASVDMATEVVVFSRIRERQKQYVAFFRELLANVRAAGAFPMRDTSPEGKNWIHITGIPEQGPQVAIIAFSFGRNHRFRIELYIDTGDGARNKRIFDHLYARRREVEERLLPESDDSLSNPPSASISWERLDGKRACRVALQCSASVTDPEVERKLVIAWAAGAAGQFEKIMNQLVTEALQEGA